MGTKPSKPSGSPSPKRRGPGLRTARTGTASPAREPGAPIRLLQGLRLFQGVPVPALRRIAALMQPCAFAQGEAVFREGDPAHDFFVLAAGRLEVTVKGADPEGPPSAVIEAPAWFGELAIMIDEPRLSTVTALTPCQVWKLSCRAFEAFFAEQPTVGRNLIAALIRRLREKNRDFVNQSAIALERSRLLTDLQRGTAELAALANVTRTINSSLDLDETLTTISTYAGRLTRSDSALIFLYDAGRDVLTVRASYNAPEGYLAEIGERPIPREAARSRQVPSDCSLTVRAVVGRAPAQIANISAAHSYPNRALLLRWGYEAVLVVPLLHDERVIGAMSVLRKQAGEFSDREIELVTTFASHSAIAIEHARLFQESQARNRALQEALGHQTVTSNFLRKLNQATFDLQSTLETLVEHATHLCGATGGLIFTLEEGAFRWVAHHGAPEEFLRHLRENPIHPGRGGLVDRTALECRPVQIPDVLADPEYRLLEAQRAGGYRSVLGIPLLREGSPIGVITVYRTEVRPFTDKEIELLTSFADMAVTAIEKVRLFGELKSRTEELARLVEELRALSATTQAVNSSLDLNAVLCAIAEQACKLCKADAGLITELVEPSREFRPCATWNVRPEFVRQVLAAPPTWGKGASGQSAASRGPVQIPDVLAAEGYPWREVIAGEGYRAILSVPLLRDGRAIGTIAVARRTPGAFADRFVGLLTTFANQISIALEHARLFRELQDKAALLEEASRHKSSFLASMSHELRTPLNAIIGFSEVLLDPSLAVSEAERQQFLTDILSSGKHLLKLINEVLDLAKIEAGRMELHLASTDLAELLEQVRSTTRPLAARKSIGFSAECDPAIRPFPMDAARIRQVLLNLVGNALKFTPEGGQVWVTARRVDDGRGGELQRSRGAEEQRRTGAAEDAPLPLGSSAPLQFVEVSVRDTGPGIPPEDHERIFLEFQQAEAAAAASKPEGTGLGLTLTKRFVEMHGGRIWVTSTVGHGATFTFTLPLGHPDAPSRTPAPAGAPPARM